MSTSIKTCRGCKSLILSDTSECPECGEVFDEAVAEANAAAAAAQDMKKQNMYDDCKKCGASVRSGLVRCWNCNSFMRKDVEDKYAELISNPQKIIFSEVPEGQRTELIPARVTSRGEEVFDAEEDDDGFELGTGVTSRAGTTPPVPNQESNDDDDEFELDQPVARATPQPGPSPADQGAAANSNGVSDSTARPASPAGRDSEPQVESGPNKTVDNQSDGGQASSGDEDKDLDDDAFVGLALSDVRETHKRKRRKVTEARRRRVLVPCGTCGAWIRIYQDQAGRTVRCQKCKTPFIVPQLKKKQKSDSDESSGSQLDLAWMEDVPLHVVNPTDITLKPGSLEKGSQPVDITFHDGKLHIVKFAVPAKKSLFGKADGPPEIPEQRRKIREALNRAGGVKSVPVGDLYSIGQDNSSGLRLVQPVAEAHASMFAGVPVFGTGRIAVYLPVAMPDSHQVFLSLTLSQARLFAEQLQSELQLNLSLQENGVPVSEQKDMLKCKFLEIPVESIRNLEYYENDPAFELELTGYRCGTCPVVISEDGRARKKLGGANGKGIAKAKCPGCSGKMGDNRTYKIVKAPESGESE